MTAADQVRLQLERILGSPQFSAAQRRSRLLRFLVEQSLIGAAGDLKESVIASEVFDRGAGHDPKIDSLVRVEMGRLRSRLIEYYAGAGRQDAVRIEIPNGRYAPVMTFCDAPPAVEPISPTPVEGNRHWRWVAAILLVLCMAAAAFAVWRRRPNAAPPAIAVLPFLNLTGDPDEDFLGDSITDELTGTLAESADLRVVARTSAFVFKGKNIDVREIGRALGTNAVLEGSISRRSDQLSIVAQLIRTQDGYHLWSQTFTFAPQELQTTEGEIVRSAANILRGKQSEFVGASRLMSTTNPEAHDLYLRASYTLNRGTVESMQTSLKLAHQAIEKDPSYPLPYWVAAMAEHNLSNYGAESAKVSWGRAMQALDEAIRLAPRFGDAHALHALGVYSANHDWPRAEKEFREGIRLGSVTAPSLYGWGLTTRGRFAEAHQQFQAALDTDPLGASPHLNHLVIDYFEGNERGARAEADRVLELNPDNVVGLVQLAFGDAMVRNCAAARADFARLNKIGPALGVTPFVDAMTSITCGEPAKARRILAKMDAPNYPGRSFFQMALLDALLGDRDGVFNHLEKAAADYENAVFYLKVHPLFAPYRNDPRFSALAARLGL
jgi:adenylate cyclase